MSKESGASNQAISVPKGGGATRGLGDGFTPDFNRGTGSYSVEIQVPKGYRDLAPSLALAYNSAAGDGPFGFGWNMALPHVQIDTDAGVADYLAPTFVFGGETLLEMPDGTFRPQVENAFHRIRRAGDGWEFTDRSGNLTLYGTTAGSRISGEIDGTARIFAWLPDLVRDTSGNEIRYEYLRDGGNLYLSRIVYAKFEVRFEYAERHDPTVNRRAGFPVTTRLRGMRDRGPRGPIARSRAFAATRLRITPIPPHRRCSPRCAWRDSSGAERHHRVRIGAAPPALVHELPAFGPPLPHRRRRGDRWSRVRSASTGPSSSISTAMVFPTSCRSEPGVHGSGRTSATGRLRRRGRWRRSRHRSASPASTSHSSTRTGTARPISSIWRRVARTTTRTTGAVRSAGRAFSAATFRWP